MSEQVSEERVAVKLNEDYCSSCSIRSSLCPFEAIKRETETGKTFLEIEKCQVCGICYSTCPGKAIASNIENVIAWSTSDEAISLCLNLGKIPW